MFLFEQGSVNIIGPTMSGKSTLLRDIIKYKCFSKEVVNILCCYVINQPIYTEIATYVKVFELHEGLPTKATVEDFLQNEGHSIIILDDLGHQLGSNPEIAGYFTIGTHHLDFTLITILHQLFSSGSKYSKLMQMNSGYICLFSQSRDSSQVQILARQLYPMRWKLFMEAYEDAISRKHGYLVIDTRPYAPEDRKLLSSILPGEKTTVYILKSIGSRVK